MYFPRYWAKGFVDGPGRTGQKLHVEAWGWSDVSESDARVRATSRAQSLLAQLPPPGRDPRRNREQYYENRPFREPILQDLSQGTVKALITRNSFGCDVLNTDCVAFADIDHEPPQLGIFGSLFGARKKLAEAQVAWENQTLQKLQQWQSSNPSWSFRVYRTAGGLRLLRTSGLLQADSPEAIGWLEAVGSDPLYLRLCKTQKSFRARLTPKPWRCGLSQLSVCFPWAEKSEQAELEKWMRNYQPKCASFAVCEYLQTMGSDRPARELQSLVTLHDQKTSVGSALPLA